MNYPDKLDTISADKKVIIDIYFFQVKFPYYSEY